jgi:hypothetical protein
MERGLQHDTVRFTHQLTFVKSIAHKATGALQWLCSDAPDLLRRKARPNLATQQTHTGKNSRHHRTNARWRSPGSAALI